MELVLTALPILAFFACPIMMALCFLGMRRMADDASLPLGIDSPLQSPADRVVVLRRQLDAIQAELSTLQASEPHVRLGTDGGYDHFPRVVVPGASDATQSSA